MPQSALYYQLKIQVDGVKPSIFRTILVDSENTFLELHKLIQKLFDLEGYHLWQFEKGKRQFMQTIALPIPKDQRMFFNDEPEYNAKKIKLSNIFQNEKDTVGYWYDFGDDWRFTITLQKIIPQAKLSPQVKKIPLLLNAQGPMLFEDIGGPFMMKGILELYEYLQSKKKLSKKERNEWGNVLGAVLGWDRLEEEGDEDIEEDFVEMVSDTMNIDWENFSL